MKLKLKRKLTLLLFLTMGLVFAQEKPKEVLSEEIIRIKQPSETAIKEITFINSKMESYLSDFEKAIKNHYKVHGNSVGFEYDSNEQFQLIKSYVLSDKEIIVRQYAAMQIPNLIMYGVGRLEQKDSTLKRICTEIMYPEDIMWTLDKNAILFFGNFYSNKAIQDYINNPSFSNSTKEKQSEKIREISVKAGFEFREAVYKENPSRVVRANALLSILDLFYAIQDYEKGNDYYHILKKEYLDIEEVEERIVQYNPNKNTKIGNQVPKFNSADIRSSENLSPNSLLGKYYLIQFWSTSCAPCISEMKELHHLYEQYKDKGFTIVSFAMGDPTEVLEKFWTKKWAMPWHNIQLKESWKDEIAISFEVQGIPNQVFVDREGKILENNDSFRNGRLEEVISKYFEKEQTELQ